VKPAPEPPYPGGPVNGQHVNVTGGQSALVRRNPFQFPGRNECHRLLTRICHAPPAEASFGAAQTPRVEAGRARVKKRRGRFEPVSGGPIRPPKRRRGSRCVDLLTQLSGSGHPTPAACAADKYLWTVLWEIEQVRAISSTCAWSASSVAIGSLNFSVEASRHRCPTPSFQSHADHRSELRP
jgi:hypothetical protein